MLVALICWTSAAAAGLVARPVRAAGRLVLVRHGQSAWNRENRFTGWVDVDLTERGIIEAREAGRLLREEGVEVDLVLTSFLRRAIRSACLVLSVLNQCFVPLEKNPLLNEQHPGLLSGLNKVEVAKEHGVEQVMRWRRSHNYAPPPLPLEGLRQVCVSDTRYRDIEVPRTESLLDCKARVDRVWEEKIAPALLDGRTVMVVSHGNTLRAMVKRLDRISNEDIFHVDLPTAVPIIYDLEYDEQAASLSVVPAPQGFWGESSAARNGRFLMEEAQVRAAQQAMRDQTLKDVQVSPYSQQVVKPVKFADASSSNVISVGDKGETYNVRERPPSYFAQESERIATEAELEYGSFIRQGKLTKRVSGRKKQVKATLTFLRHGYSEWNRANLFTGWKDVDLTIRGRDEARRSGRVLRAANVKRIERVYTSLLSRAIKTAWLMLDEMELQWVPLSYSWRLNERHYGSLHGLNKKECVNKFGLRQVQRWRRGIYDKPEGWNPECEQDIIDRRYNNVPFPEVESLDECRLRAVPLLRDEIMPALAEAIQKAEARAEEAAAAAAAAAGAGEAKLEGGEVEVPNFLVVASENVLRALIWELEGLSEDEVPLLDVPFATPLVFQLDEHLRPLSTPWAQQPLKCGWYMGDPDRVKAVQKEIQGDLFGQRGAEGEALLPPPEDLEALDDGDEDTPCLLPAEGEDGRMEWVCE